VSFLAFASPIVATVLGYVFLDQELTVVQVIGALVIVGAVVLAQPRPAKPSPDWRNRLPFLRDRPIATYPLEDK
jgi:probable blue pigment (indigoidine) exporter